MFTFTLLTTSWQFPVIVSQLQPVFCNLPWIRGGFVDCTLQLKKQSDTCLLNTNKSQQHRPISTVLSSRSLELMQTVLSLSQSIQSAAIPLQVYIIISKAPWSICFHWSIHPGLCDWALHLCFHPCSLSALLNLSSVPPSMSGCQRRRVSSHASVITPPVEVLIGAPLSAPAVGEWSAALWDTQACRWSMAPLIQQHNG